MEARARRSEQWRTELLEKLEAVHMLAVEADAFQSAFKRIYDETPWPSNGDPDRRRALNHMGCLSEELRKRLAALLQDSQDVVKFAMTSGG